MPGNTAPGPPRPLAYYANVAHEARVYDYLLLRHEALRTEWG